MDFVDCCWHVVTTSQVAKSVLADVTFHWEWKCTKHYTDSMNWHFAMLLKFLLLLFCAVHCCIMMMGFPSFICAGFTEWYCFLCQVEHKVTPLWTCPYQCGIFQSESCNQIVRPHIYWIEKVCKLPQVTNYPKFLREIELYGRSNITHMEERVIDFPDNLQDFFDKNPEVWVWTRAVESESLKVGKSLKVG